MLPEGEGHVERPRHRSSGLLIAGALLTVLLAIAAGAGMAAHHQSAPARYRSVAELLIDQEPAVSRARDNGILVKLTTMRIKYVDVVTTTTFSSALARTLGLPPGQVRGTVSAFAPQESLLLQVAATTPDRARSQALAQGAADKLVADLAQEQTDLGITGSAQVTLKVMTPAPAAAKIAPLRKDSIKLGVVAGGMVLVLGLALIAVARRRS
ncbi:MAG: hypothetical protein JWP14_1425 [Frankiales bacterium]|nr:hypothetical protein [Frankiales bacterium]